ncbi:hypothetical protein G9A89_012605 [Geosiphon pyriformis]|nr:hypothetical protein G9A89_012605 [Geosiphon pyriformis]
MGTSQFLPSNKTEQAFEYIDDDEISALTSSLNNLSINRNVINSLAASLQKSIKEKETVQQTDERTVSLRKQIVEALCLCESISSRIKSNINSLTSKLEELKKRYIENQEEKNRCIEAGFPEEAHKLDEVIFKTSAEMTKTRAWIFELSDLLLPLVNKNSFAL